MEEVKRNSLRAWILAARPKTLTGAITPVMIGSALAYMDGHFQWLPALICCLFAGLMQIAANFINDLFDYLKGTDREDRLGPERACAQGWISPRAMRNGIIVTVVPACESLCSVAMRLAIVLSSAFACATLMPLRKRPIKRVPCK